MLLFEAAGAVLKIGSSLNPKPSGNLACPNPSNGTKFNQNSAFLVVLFRTYCHKKLSKFFWKHGCQTVPTKTSLEDELRHQSVKALVGRRNNIENYQKTIFFK